MKIIGTIFPVLTFCKINKICWKTIRNFTDISKSYTVRNERSIIKHHEIFQVFFSIYCGLVLSQLLSTFELSDIGTVCGIINEEFLRL